MSRMFGFVEPKNAPCMNCQNRHENCHAECDSYADFVSLRKERRRKIFIDFNPNDYHRCDMMTKGGKSYHAY